MDYSYLQSRASTSSSTSSSPSYIPPHRTQIHPRMINSKIQQTQYQNLSPQQQKWIVLVSFLLMLPFVFYLFSTARKTHLHFHTSTRFDDSTSTLQSNSYGVVIQYGASRSKIRVFEFDARFEFNDWVDGMVVETKRNDVKGTILELVEFAKGSVGKVFWGGTKVLFFAVEEEMEGLSEDVREGIFESCREVLSSSGFRFKNEWASVIKGMLKKLIHEPCPVLLQC